MSRQTKTYNLSTFHFVTTVCVHVECVLKLYFLFLSLVTIAVGSCERLHVHDESLINTVGKFTCQPGKLYKSAMPKGIGKSTT